MISVKEKDLFVLINIDTDIINTSATRFDLSLLKDAIISQLNRVYNGPVGKYKLQLSIHVSILKKISQCSPQKILFQIVDTIPGNNPAEADFKGLRIKLNKYYVNDIISGKNIRTIPHEIGHLLGWDHPHAKASYESVNLTAHRLEQELTEDERKNNLMSQTWYAQKALVPMDKAVKLSEKQIELLLLHEISLNKNRHLNYFLWWKKIV
ncbi:MAG: hypothetical protein H7141_10890 [Burkholderiales bacterium]|nr:hypothetical protein [Bacteroidia bacterium]